MIKRCKVWNIARVDGDWAGRKVLFVAYVAKVLRWLKVHYKFAMSGAPQVAMRVASPIWQIFFASQTLQVFCLALRKKAQYVVVMRSEGQGNILWRVWHKESRKVWILPGHSRTTRDWLKKTINLGQVKYVGSRMLKRFGMEDLKPLKTPLDVNV
jgi:hypothetical protein